MVRQAKFSLGPISLLWGAVPAGLVGPVHGAHLRMQAAEGYRVNGRRGAAPFFFFPVSPMTPSGEKERLRAQARAARRAAHQAVDGADERVSGHFLTALAGIGLAVRGTAVAGYWPMGAELDVRPLLHDLHRAGADVALPVVLGRGRALLFRRWQPGMDLEGGSLGTRHPGEGAAEVRPRLVLTPLVAFDGAGYRLGQGGGYYDRTLADLRAAGPLLAVGIAYAAQRLDSVPRDVHDQPLDWMITEEGAVRFA